MPYKDAEKRKEAMREQMRARRAAVKDKSGENLPVRNSKLDTRHTPIPKPIEKIEKPAPVAVIEKPPSAPVKIESAPPMITRHDVDGDLTGYSVTEIEAARDVIDKTLEIIERRGWVMWKCAKLNNDRVIVVKDSSVREYPAGYPVYTLDELNEISGMTLRTIKLIHAVKLSGVQDALPGFFPEIIKREKN